MEKLTEVLQQYAVYPQAIVHVTDRLYKVKADGKQYALKRSRLKDKQLDIWQTVYHLASKKGLPEILPVYLTVNKQLYVENGGEIYYLSPWIEGTIFRFEQKTIESLYKILGKLHLRTKKKYKLNKSSVEKEFSSYKSNCKAEEKKLLIGIEAIENRHFPSPFELQVLTHYRDLSHALKQSQYLAEQIISYTNDAEEWTASLTHGGLRESHIFEQYIINWEQAAYRHPYQDLYEFFTSECAKGYRRTDRFIEGFPTYLEENPFTDLELSMLKLYLLDTSDYLALIDEKQANNRANRSMVEKTIALEKNYRRIQFGLYFNNAVTALESAHTVEGD